MSDFAAVGKYGFRGEGSRNRHSLLIAPRTLMGSRVPRAVETWSSFAGRQSVPGASRKGLRLQLSGMAQNLTPRLDRRQAVDLRLVVGAVALVAVGYLAGTASPFGAQQSRTETGLAMRANDVNGLALFTSDEGNQFSFSVDEIHWADGSTHGSGNPPCLQTPLEEAGVDLGVMWVAAPDDVSYERAAWLRCN